MRASGGDGAAHLVLVDGIALPVLVIRLVEALLLDQVAYIDVFQGNGGLLREKFGMGGLSRAGRARDDDDGALA